jgi:DNA-binding transcriptional LysR family regulator
MEWESRLGRRLRVRDLYILSTVVKSGSMAQAARQLAMSQPAVSEAIANLEQLLRVRLLDRSTHGVEPTIYAGAILKRSMTVFDELQQGVRDIEFLADPTTGELAIGYSESIAGTALLSTTLERFSEQYPGVVARAEIVGPPVFRFPRLRDRAYDLVLARMWTSTDHFVEDLNVEFLFDDPLVVVASIHSPWARRRKVDLAELFHEPWLLPAPKSTSHDRLAEAFGALGLGLPAASLVTSSIDLRARLSARGRRITVVPRSVLRHGDEGHQLKVLPVDLPSRPWPITIVTLKNRTLSPVVERFIECAHAVAKSLGGTQRGYPAHRRKPHVA